MKKKDDTRILKLEVPDGKGGWHVLDCKDTEYADGIPPDVIIRAIEEVQQEEKQKNNKGGYGQNKKVHTKVAKKRARQNIKSHV